MSFWRSLIQVILGHRQPMMATRLPLVVILGATGTGKSKLAIELAERFGGEIISADSMQVYKGLDIITNKVSATELQRVPHHFIDFVDPLDAYTVVDFRNAAVPLIHRLLDEGKLPIIVGGTNYYIESLLWTVLVDNVAVNVRSANTLLCHREPKVDTIDASTDDLHEKLKQVDPERAKMLHPNDRRKIIRSLEVYNNKGTTHSSILKEQKQLSGGSDLGGPLRFSHCCMLWLQCKSDVLGERLDSRVEDMMRQGLVQELEAFHRLYNEQSVASGSEVDYTKGIFQSIGFKEFHQYLTLPRDRLNTPAAERLLLECVERLKQVTRRYAKAQLKWITNRFIRCADRQVPPVFPLEATDPCMWDEDVAKPATEIMSSFLNGTLCPIEALEIDSKRQFPSRATISCDVCHKTVVGEDQWKAHLKSKKHVGLVKREAMGLDIKARCPSRSYDAAK